MKKISKNQITKEYIFLLFVAMNPILDIIYTLTEYYMDITIPINQVIRVGFIFYLLYAFNLKKYYKYIFVFGGVLALNEITYIIRGINFGVISNLGYDAKLISIIVFIFATYEALVNNKIKVKELIKSIAIASFIIVLGIILPSILGVGLSTYGTSSRFGLKGLFNAQNAITATLLIQLPIVAVAFLYFKQKRYLCLYIAVVIVLNLIGTKVGSVGSIFIIGSTLVFILINNWRHKINYKKFITVIIGICAIGVVLVSIFFNKIIFILNNLPYNKSEFPSFFSYLVSNRDAQIKILHQYIINSENRILSLLFGLGFTQGNDVLKDTQIGFQIIEMDFNAIYYYSGIIITIIIVGMFIYSLYAALKNVMLKRNLNEVLIGLAFFIGTIHLILGGHVIYEAVTNLYLSVVIGIIIYNFKVINHKYDVKCLNGKKKVLFIGWTLTAGGGVENVLSKLISKLPRDKYSIELFEYIDFGVNNKEYPKEVKKLPSVLKYPKDKGFVSVKFFAIREKFLDSMVRILPKLFRKIYIKEKYDIEIACTYLTPSFILVNKKNGKNVTWIHGPLDEFIYKEQKNILKRFVSFYLYKRQKKAFEISDSIVVISNKVYDSVTTVYPEYKGKVIKIYNGYDIEGIKEKSNEEEIKFDVPTIISVGRLDENKNNKLLIETCDILKERISKFQAIIIGEGEERATLEKMIKDLNLENKVKLYGYRSNPYPYIKAADIFVMSSFSEGFPTVVAESMILKTPVIMTKVSGCDELTNFGKCGVLIDAKAIDAAEAILEVMSNNIDRAILTNDAYENIYGYSLERQKDEFVKLLNKLLI